MKSKLKKSLVIGTLFAGIAYSITLYTGFNSSSLSILLYLYVFLSILLSLDVAKIAENNALERIVIVAEDEEDKLKKIFTGEEYRINGTVEKV